MSCNGTFRRRASARYRAARGFTLLELLVALAIFALVGAMAYGGLSSVLETRAQTTRSAQQLANLQRALAIVQQDVQQAVGRTVRDGLGGQEAAFRLDPSQDVPLQLTRAGWTNPLGQPRASMQRVGYQVRDRTLYRLAWPVLDRAPQSRATRRPLIEETAALDLRVLDRDGAWHHSWPPAGSEASELSLLPRAVELTVELPDWGRIRRLWLLGPAS